MGRRRTPFGRNEPGEQEVRYSLHRASRFVLAVKDDETEPSAVAFLKEAVQAFPFRVSHVLTDRGSCFTADGFEAVCRTLGVEHRKTRPYTPTNGMVERFNGRIQREVLGITVASHRDLETLLRGFNQGLQCAPPTRAQGPITRHGRARAPQRSRSPRQSGSRSAVRSPEVISLAKDVSHPDS